MPNHEIQEKIETYLQGRLSSEEIEDLWVDLLREPEYLEYMETLANLHSLRSDNPASPSTGSPSGNGPNYKRWWLSVAAVFVLIAGALLVLKNHMEKNPGALKVISLNEFESAQILRSSRTNLNPNDSLLNLGYETLVDGKPEIARQYFEQLISTGTQDQTVIKAWMDIGMIDYNEHHYGAAVKAFNNSLARSRYSPLYLDKNIWLLANSYLKTGNTDSAKAVLRKSGNREGIYAQKNRELLKTMQKQ